ncbi:MAG: hypothetical protein V1800_05510 [Candidatus Latescibacterota bacterium]
MTRTREYAAETRSLRGSGQGLGPCSRLPGCLLRFTFLVLLVVVCATTISHASPGGAAGAFLQLGGGALAGGMGGAVAAATEDIYSLYWNPAGLDHLTGTELVASYRFMSLDRRCFFSGIAQPLEPDGGYALGWLFAGTEVARRDINGAITGEMLDSENAFYFAFARGVPLPVPASLGLTAKYLYQTLADQTAKGLGFDLGLQLLLPGNLRMGWVIKNIGMRLSWKTNLWERETASEDGIPRSLVVGLAHRSLSDRLLLAADVSKSRDTKTDVRLGSEWVVHPMVSVRCGASHFLESEMRALSAGLDVRTFRAPGFFRFGYAYMTDPIGAGSSHVVSLMMGF